jgi:hypothetical protein
VTVDLATLPDPSTLPIPDDVQPDKRWSPLMVEIADHIGARATLELVARFGGQLVYVPADPTRSPFRDALGDQAADELSRVFGRERLLLPVGRLALMHARRQGVIARVRSSELNLMEAARLLRTSRRFVGKLINQTSEGTALPAPPARRSLADPRQTDLFGE